VQSASKPWWQQATALVSLSAGGAITGFSFVPKAAADMRSPASVPVHLLALEHSVRPARASDTALRSAIVNVATYYLQMAQGKTPAEMEAIIWQRDSIDGADHGASCAAFASLTLELAAQVVGQQSWVTGGTSYPWPLHQWADVRVGPNPSSLGVVSIRQDAQAHQRWHALGDGYLPQPGDWVLFDGHVEVVTGHSGGALQTIGADSLPDYSVNAHQYPDPLTAQGVIGFVNNGALPGAGTSSTLPSASTQPARSEHPARGHGQRSGHRGRRSQQEPDHAGPDLAAIPGASTAPPAIASPQRAAQGTAAIPGLRRLTHHRSRGPKASASAPYRSQHRPPASTPVHGTHAEQAFIGEIAPGALAAQREYGVPASVTIAQAIDESGWGQSNLAIKDHNLFGIKGTGPAGSDPQPTQEYINGELVTRTTLFRVYHSTAESIYDHGKLLATSGYYLRSMSERHNPNAFAAALTGIYATDPGYGAKLIDIMRQYDLYRYDHIPPASTPPAPTPPPATPPTATPPSATPPPATPAPPSPSPATSTSPSARPSASGSLPPPPTSPAPSPAASPAQSAPPSATVPPRSSPPSPAFSAPGHQSSPPQPSRSPVVPTPPQQSPPPTGDAVTVPPGGASIPGVETAGPAVPLRPAAATAAPGTAAPAITAPGASTPASPAHASPAHANPVHASSAQVAPASAVQASAVPASVTAGPDTESIAYRPLRAGLHPTRATPLAEAAAPGGSRVRPPASRRVRPSTARYQHQIPPSVRTAFTALARVPLIRDEPLYRDVASHTGIRWELLAACDWMQCEARPRHSPVHGEKLGAINPDGTVYRTKSEALQQCADDLVELAAAVYGLDLTEQGNLSIRDLASVFAAFRWGGLLKAHRTSAMEFPYSVAGLTAQHVSMRWPNIADPKTPDKPGTRFRRPFGAVPIVLCLDYPATV
jgi:flagellum-specific peptidoglycan hydrolase FlgJ